MGHDHVWKFDSSENGLNPFPASAIARLSDGTSPGINIDTPASIQALRFVDSYLNSAANSDNKEVRAGNVMAIVGEYGTGKTHIAMQILHRIQSADIEGIHTLYLDAPADTFLALYRDRFMTKLKRSEVRALVAWYYTEIVASDLETSELTKFAAGPLRSGEASPESVVRRLGLMQSDLLRRLDAELKSVAESEDFGVALALFLRPAFEATVWDWLCGGAPDPVLVERGVTRTIDSDSAALEAIGVFAFLYGRKNHRLVLVIDELEKVLAPGSNASADDSALLAFKKLLEVFGQTNGFLILSGLPDFLDSLPEDAAQRIGLLIRPQSLTADDAVRYIEAAQSKSTEETTLKPFSYDVVDYIVDLSGGNARRIVKLCYYAYQVAEAARTDVTRAMVRDVARDQFELVTREDIQSIIARVLDANGWIYTTRHNWGEVKNAVRSDFWLPIGDDGLGCSIVISQSVLQPADAAQLVELGRNISSSAPVGSLSMLVVNGYLADSMSEALRDVFAKVIAQPHRGFLEDFEAVIKGLYLRVEAFADEDALSVIKDRVDQLVRQNAVIRTLVDSIANDSPRSGMIRRAVESGLRKGIESKPGTSRFLHPGAALIDEIFDEILFRIQRILAFNDSILSSQFSEIGRIVSHVDIRRSKSNGAGITVEKAEFIRASAPLTSLSTAVQAFRETILDLVENEEINIEVVDATSDACHAFDSMMMIFRDLIDWRVLVQGRSLRWQISGIAHQVRGTSSVDDMSLQEDLEVLPRRVFELVQSLVT